MVAAWADQLPSGSGSAVPLESSFSDPSRTVQFTALPSQLAPETSTTIWSGLSASPGPVLTVIDWGVSSMVASTIGEAW